MNRLLLSRPLTRLGAVAFVALVAAAGCRLDDRTVAIFEPTDWTLSARTPLRQNRFDVDAQAVFTHVDTGERIRTRFFYDGGSRYVLRFTGTAVGTWEVATTSDVAELDGLTATVEVEPAPGAPGFVTSRGNRWARSGTGHTFVPNFVMWYHPGDLHERPDRVDEAVDVFLDGHGFNGLHILVLNEWFALGSLGPDDHASRNPDPRTFAVLEDVIRRVYAEGGTVHLWYSGDRENGGYLRWGPGSTEEMRLLDYMAARLGPLPGWTMGYGFDVNEDFTRADVERWHAHFTEASGWKHLLGVRTEKDRIDDGLHRTDGEPFCRTCDYESWVDHRPDYDLYAQLIDRNPSKPCFLEDRFRIRAEDDIFRRKNYSANETRRGMWHATLAGGAANIWGNLVGSPARGVSVPYENADAMAAYAAFWERRFLDDMQRCNAEEADGLCLKTPTSSEWVVYREDAASIEIDLRGMPAASPAVAVDAAAPYTEIALGSLEPAVHVFEAPYVSDWAVAVGAFPEPIAPEPEPEPDPPGDRPPRDPDEPIYIFIPHPLNDGT